MATSSRSSKATSEVEIRQRNVGNDPRSASAAAQNPDAEDDIEIDDHVNEGNHDDMAGNGKSKEQSFKVALVLHALLEKRHKRSHRLTNQPSHIHNIPPRRSCRP